MKSSYQQKLCLNFLNFKFKVQQNGEKTIENIASFKGWLQYSRMWQTFFNDFREIFTIFGKKSIRARPTIFRQTHKRKPSFFVLRTDKENNLTSTREIETLKNHERESIRCSIKFRNFADKKKEKKQVKGALTNEPSIFSLTRAFSNFVMIQGCKWLQTK